MLQVLLRLIGRLLGRAVVKPAIALTTIGAAGDYGATFHDLRGDLPKSATQEYARRPLENVVGVVWHHSATKGQSIRNIAEFHTEVRKWPAIAYHFGIGYDGAVYILNDPTTTSYHAQGYNRKTIGVVLIGDYESRDLTPEMIASIARLQAHLKEELHLEFSWWHGQSKSTLCPGKYAISVLRPIMYGPLPGK